jgi:pyridoxine 5-phosphate synthase
MRLYVNIDHVATLRQARRADEPDPVAAARLCEAAGADGITAHLREDRRHVDDADLTALARSVTTVLNAELALAPDRRGGGSADFARSRRRWCPSGARRSRPKVASTSPATIRASKPPSTSSRPPEAGSPCFIDPDLAADRCRASAGRARHRAAHRALRPHLAREPDALDQLARAARHGRAIGLAVHAGHGLTYLNVQPVVAISEVEEVNIGHSIVSRAVMTGMTEAVSEMRRLIDAVRPPR